MNFICQDILEKPIKYNYDAVFSLDVIEHVPKNYTDRYIINLNK